MLRPGNHYNVLWDDYRVLKCYNQGTKSWDEYLSKINWDIDYAPEWDGSIQQPAIMTDTEISINNASELAWVAQQTNSGADSFAGKTIKLLFDLNLGGAKKQNWTPIGTLDHPFKGTFDGDVFYIRSLYISSEDAPYVGLFGYVQDASITQCRVMGEITANYTGNLSGTSNIGGICGAIGGYAVPTSITKSLSDLEIKVNNGTTTVNVGGICGLLSGSVNMEDTRNSSSITVVSGKTSANAGGICGSAMSTSMAYPVIKHCYNDHISLNVTGEETSILGGICGYTDNSELKILNCFVGGRMYLKGNGYLYCGGILGGTNEVATPMIAYATCEALISVNRTDNAGNAYTGGIAGYGNASIFASASTSEKIEASTGSFVAGILGAGTSAKIASCSYSGLSDIAGIIAKADSGCEIANCFYASSKAIGEGTPKSDNSKKYASSAWPTDALAGWGATKPDFWPQSPDWESPWSSLGSWRDEAPAYPVVKFEWANY